MARRESTRRIVIERSGGSSLWWFLVGGTLGAGLALLFAPQSGDRTRRAVGRKLGKLRDAADSALEDLRETLSPEDRVHRSLADARDDADEEAEEIEAPGTPGERVDGAAPVERPRRGVVSARHELEQRLAEARARRQRALAEDDEEPVA
jgi:gas vesicle protein